MNEIAFLDFDLREVKDDIKANIYIIRAIMYNDLKPKYIELYSKNPPNIAPRIFDDKAFGTELILFNSLEKASPENNRGKESIIGTNKYKKSLFKKI